MTTKKQYTAEEERRAREFVDQFTGAYKKALNADAKAHGETVEPSDSTPTDAPPFEARVRAIAAKHVREECITAELLDEFAATVANARDEDIDEDADAYIDRWFRARVEREPKIGPP